MTTVTLDSNDLPAILADAGVELETPAAGKPESKGGAEPGKSEGETGAEEKKGDGEQHAHSDDQEDENGLTDEEREGLTEKMRRTIGKRHRMMREAEEFAAAQFNEKRMVEQRLREAEQELARLRGAKPQQAEESKKAPAKPQRQDFATETDYLDAMIQFGVEQQLAALREQEAREAAERQQQQVVQTANERISRAREIVPDFDEVVSAADMEVPPVVAGYMQKSEMFAELGYHFAKNPDVLLSLSKLPADEQLVKIGKIESTLRPFEPKSKTGADNDNKSSHQQYNGQTRQAAPSESTGSTPSKPRGSGAPVITPLDGSGSAGFQKDQADMNIRETIQDWSKRNQVNLGIRRRH